MYVQMVDISSNIAFETIHKVDTLNKATRLWETYFPEAGTNINIILETTSYDYYIGSEKVASLMKVGTVPEGYERYHSLP